MTELNEHEFRVARVESLLRLATEELATLAGETSPICRGCKLFVELATWSVESAIRQLAYTKRHDAAESGAID